MVRFPDGMRATIKAAADANNRSMNAEIVQRLSDSFENRLVFRIPPFLGDRIEEVARARGVSLRHEVHETLQQKYPVPDLDEAVEQLMQQLREMSLSEEQWKALTRRIRQEVDIHKAGD